jgi:dihydro-heme d1 dehydrogenase
LFVVVEAGDHHATILDGDRLEPLTRFATRFALHGGPNRPTRCRTNAGAARCRWHRDADASGQDLNLPARHTI